jgi:hypothetical protein
MDEKSANRRSGAVGLSVEGHEAFGLRERTSETVH